MKRATATFGYAELRCTFDVLNDLFEDGQSVKEVKEDLEKRIGKLD